MEKLNKNKTGFWVTSSVFLALTCYITFALLTSSVEEVICTLKVDIFIRAMQQFNLAYTGQALLVWLFLNFLGVFIFHFSSALEVYIFVLARIFWVLLLLVNIIIAFLTGAFILVFIWFVLITIVMRWLVWILFKCFT